jgi:hypothetical protein
LFGLEGDVAVAEHGEDAEGLGFGVVVDEVGLFLRLELEVDVDALDELVDLAAGLGLGDVVVAGLGAPELED